MSIVVKHEVSLIALNCQFEFSLKKLFFCCVFFFLKFIQGSLQFVKICPLSPKAVLFDSSRMQVLIANLLSKTIFNGLNVYHRNKNIPSQVSSPTHPFHKPSLIFGAQISLAREDSCGQDLHGYPPQGLLFDGS